MRYMRRLQDSEHTKENPKRWKLRGTWRITKIIILLFIIISLYLWRGRVYDKIGSLDYFSTHTERQCKYRSSRSRENIYNNSKNNSYDLSFIIATRNDNYGANPIMRLRFTLQQLSLYDWSKYGLAVEIFIVEWNYMESNPRIWEYPEIRELVRHLNAHQDDIDIDISVHSVPPAYNDAIDCFPTRMHCPFYEYAAKNIGLRRARGEWKLLMNIDDIFSINLLHYLGDSISKGVLDRNGIYQAHRRSIKHWTQMDDYYSAKDIQIMPICEYNDEYGAPIKKQALSDCFKPVPANPNDDYDGLCTVKEETAKTCVHRSSGDFTLIHNESLFKYYAGPYLEMCQNYHLDTEILTRMVNVNKMKCYFLSRPCVWYHIDHKKQKKKRNAKRNKQDANLKRMNKNIELNCNQMDKSQYIALMKESGDYDANTTYPDVDIWRQVYTYLQKHNEIIPNTFMHDIYKRNNDEWGSPNAQFSCVQLH